MAFISNEHEKDKALFKALSEAFPKEPETSDHPQELINRLFPSGNFDPSDELHIQILEANK